MTNKIKIFTTDRDLYRTLAFNKQEGILIESHQEEIRNSLDAGIVYHIVLDVIWPIGASVLSNIIYGCMKKDPNKTISINNQNVTIMNIETVVNNITIKNDVKEDK